MYIYCTLIKSKIIPPLTIKTYFNDKRTMMISILYILLFFILNLITDEIRIPLKYTYIIYTLLIICITTYCFWYIYNIHQHVLFEMVYSHAIITTVTDLYITPIQLNELKTHLNIYTQPIYLNEVFNTLNTFQYTYSLNILRGILCLLCIACIYPACQILKYIYKDKIHMKYCILHGMSLIIYVCLRTYIFIKIRQIYVQSEMKYILNILQHTRVMNI